MRELFLCQKLENLFFNKEMLYVVSRTKLFYSHEKAVELASKYVYYNLQELKEDGYTCDDILDALFIKFSSDKELIDKMPQEREFAKIENYFKEFYETNFSGSVYLRNYNNEKKQVIIPNMLDVHFIAVLIISGDEVLKVNYLDGTVLTLDPTEDRSMSFFEKIYFIEQKDLPIFSSSNTVEENFSKFCKM